MTSRVSAGPGLVLISLISSETKVLRAMCVQACGPEPSQVHGDTQAASSGMHTAVKLSHQAALVPCAAVVSGLLWHPPAMSFSLAIETKTIIQDSPGRCGCQGALQRRESGQPPSPPRV